jgi:hypothetical protein
VKGVDQARVKTWLGRFKSVKIGDEDIQNGLLRIGNTDASYFDVLIGPDFFMSHHVYVANRQRKLYFSYEGGPVFNVTRRTQAAENAPSETKPTAEKK